MSFFGFILGGILKKEISATPISPMNASLAILALFEIAPACPEAFAESASPLPAGEVAPSLAEDSAPETSSQIERALHWELPPLLDRFPDQLPEHPNTRDDLRPLDATNPTFVQAESIPAESQPF